jgi:hypothetical protein
LNLTFLHLRYHGNGRHLNFFQPPKAATHYGGYSYKVWWKESKKMFNPPFFVSMATAEKFVQPILILLAYLVPLE